MTLYNNVYADDWTGKYRLPKVYRYSYHVPQEGPVFDRRVASDHIPDLFYKLHFEDVSHQYFAVSDVKIRLDKNADDLYNRTVLKPSLLPRHIPNIRSMQDMAGH